MRWKRLALLIVPLLLLIFGGWFLWQKTHPLTLKGDVYTAEYKSEFKPLDNVASLFMDSADNITVTGAVDTSTIGDYTVTYAYQGKEYPFTVSVKDTTGPVVTLKDVSTDTSKAVKAEDFIESIEDASTYTYMMDNSEDTKEPGTYTIRFSARDQYGNTTESSAKLTRKEDRTAPTLEDFTEEITLNQGDSFQESLPQVLDDLDDAPTLDVDTGELDTDVPGDYEVAYNVSDRSGNTAVFTQTVHVKADPDFGKPVVYLTFDDGPSGHTEKILDVLKENGAVATFFVTGTNPQYFDKMKLITESGNAIALHTYSHDYASLYSSDEAYYEDLQKIHDLVQEETGVDCKVIRFPGGSSNMVSAQYNKGIMSRLTESVGEHGYVYFDWNADSTDASGNDVPADQLVTNATSAIGLEKVNLLMHDTDAKATTLEALPKIIKAYKDAGYVFKTLTTGSYAPHHGVNN